MHGRLLCCSCADKCTTTPSKAGPNEGSGDNDNDENDMNNFGDRGSNRSFADGEVIVGIVIAVGCAAIAPCLSNHDDEWIQYGDVYQNINDESDFDENPNNIDENPNNITGGFDSMIVTNRNSTSNNLQSMVTPRTIPYRSPIQAAGSIRSPTQQSGLLLTMHDTSCTKLDLLV